MKWKVFIFLGLFALAVGFHWAFFRLDSSSAAAKTPEEASSQAKDEGDCLVVVHSNGPDFLNSVISQTADPSMFLYAQILPTLLNDRFDCALRYDPGVAGTWEWGASSRKEATFHLRRDRFWEDGKPITADDVIFTFDLVGDPKVASPRANHLDRMRKENPVEKIDDYTVRFHFLEAYDPSVQLAHMAQVNLLPKHRLESMDRNEIRSAEFNRNPLSGGPFRLERWTEGQELVLSSNSKSFPSRPALLDRVVFRIVPDYNTRLTELLNGGVDMMYGLQPEDLERAAQNPNLRIVPRGYRWVDYIAWNFKDPLFQDLRLRRALALAVDCDKLIGSILTAGGKRYGRRAVSNITPEICGVENKDLTPLPYDPEGAKKLLAEAGWKDIDGDGILEKDGAKLSFTLLTYITPRLVMAAQAIQEMYRKVGVEMKVERRDFNQANQDLRGKKFQAALLGWQSELWVDPSATLHSGERFPFNFGSYSNPRVDDLLDQGPREADPSKAKKIWDELQRVVYEDQPLLLLYWRDIPVVIHRRFRDVRADVSNPLQKLEEWWVPKAEQKYKP